jgi:hypothetical protein
VIKCLGHEDPKVIMFCHCDDVALSITLASLFRLFQDGHFALQPVIVSIYFSHFIPA